jgi:2-isopropylmalate synthase
LGGGQSATAAAYIEIEDVGGNRFWGVGIDTDIIVASIKAVMSALNRSCQI